MWAPLISVTSVFEIEMVSVPMGSEARWTAKVAGSPSSNTDSEVGFTTICAEAVADKKSRAGKEILRMRFAFH